MISYICIRYTVLVEPISFIGTATANIASISAMEIDVVSASDIGSANYILCDGPQKKNINITSFIHFIYRPFDHCLRLIKIKKHFDGGTFIICMYILMKITILKIYYHFTKKIIQEERPDK